MIDEIFVFDWVVHLHDMSDENMRTDVPSAEASRSLALGLGELLRPLSGTTLDYATRLSVEDMHRLVFEESPTDMCMAQVVPIFDWSRSGGRPSSCSTRWRARIPTACSSAEESTPRIAVSRGRSKSSSGRWWSSAPCRSSSTTGTWNAPGLRRRERRLPALREGTRPRDHRAAVSQGPPLRTAERGDCPAQ